MANLLELSKQTYDYLMGKEGLKADFTLARTEENEVTVKDGKMTMIRTLYNDAVSIRVIQNQKQGTASINSLVIQDIKEAIDSALASAESTDADPCYDIAPGLKPEKFEMGALEPDMDKLLSRTMELSEMIAQRHPKIKLMEMYTKYVRGTNIYRNTNGTQDEKEFGYYELFLEYAGNDGVNSTGFQYNGVDFDSLDKPLIELSSLEKDLTDTENSLNPISITEKFEGEIILTPSCASQMLEMTIMNAAGNQAILGKTSMWLDKVGQKVASDKLTISSNPWDPHFPNHEVHTGDGFRSEDYTLIEKGVLKCFATNLYTANKCGVARAANSSLAMVVEAGDVSLDDMIKGMKKGLIVGSVSCGMPGANGELSGVAKNSFYVENGEVKGAVIETMISLNLFDLCNNITAISKERVCDGFMVMPSIQADHVTISGKA